MIIKMSSLVKLGLSLVASCLIFPSGVLAQTDSSKESSYPPTFSTDYLKECTKSAQSKGVSDTESQEYCSCTLNKIQTTYSFEELFKMNTQETSDKVPNPLKELISTCNQSAGPAK